MSSMQPHPGPNDSLPPTHHTSSTPLPPHLHLSFPLPHSMRLNSHGLFRPLPPRGGALVPDEAPPLTRDGVTERPWPPARPAMADAAETADAANTIDAAATAGERAGRGGGGGMLGVVMGAGAWARAPSGVVECAPTNSGRQAPHAAVLLTPPPAATPTPTPTPPPTPSSPATSHQQSLQPMSLPGAPASAVAAMPAPPPPPRVSLSSRPAGSPSITREEEVYALLGLPCFPPGDRDCF